MDFVPLLKPENVAGLKEAITAQNSTPNKTTENKVSTRNINTVSGENFLVNLFSLLIFIFYPSPQSSLGPNLSSKYLTMNVVGTAINVKRTPNAAIAGYKVSALVAVDFIKNKSPIVITLSPGYQL